MNQFTSKKITFCLCVLMSILSFGLCIWIHPFQENLTGLGWIKGHFFMMALWVLLGCGLNAWLSSVFFWREGKRQEAKSIVAIWLGFLMGCFIPYREGPIAFLGDLHSLLCVVCTALWVGQWIKELIFSPPLSLGKQVSQTLLLGFGLSLFLCGVCGGICFAAEGFFVCGQAWILWRNWNF